VSASLGNPAAAHKRVQVAAELKRLRGGDEARARDEYVKSVRLSVVVVNGDGEFVREPKYQCVSAAGTVIMEGSQSQCEETAALFNVAEKLLEVRRA